MKRVVALVVALFLSMSVLAPQVRATDWASVVKDVEKSIVFIEIGDQGSCTGFIIDQVRKYVLTAAHCSPGEHDILWVDRVTAKVISRDTKKDMLVVEVKDLDPLRTALKLASSNPVIGTEVLSAGYGMGLERPFFRQAHVQDDQTMIPEGGVGGPFISLDAAFVGGQSGGPVVNIAGEVVMIVQRASNTVGIGVGVEIIRERMGRFFGK